MGVGRGRLGRTSSMIGVIALAVLLTVSFVIPGSGLIFNGKQGTDHVIDKDKAFKELPVVDARPVVKPNDGASSEPRGWEDGDFVISFDEEQNQNHALRPAVAVTPTNEATKSQGWDGSVHAVWDEYDNASGFREIGYSMTCREMSGYPLEWTGETGDRVISEVRKGKAALSTDAYAPNIVVDDQGHIHVVWAQRYEDGTWEIHYSRSENNGKDWTADGAGDVLVSNRNGSQEALQISTPNIAIGNNFPPSKADPTAVLYVSWVEYHLDPTFQEVYFSRSIFDGEQWLPWTGAEADEIISKKDQTYAYNPCIGAGGPRGDYVQVAWVQNIAGGARAEGDEIFWSQSKKYGNKGTWSSEKPISLPGVPPAIMQIGNVEMASLSGLDDIYVIWNQVQTGGKADAHGIYYSGYDGQEWRIKELLISNLADGNPPMSPSISMVDYTRNKAPAMEIQVVWSELDEKSEYKTTEIHNSMSYAPWENESWTGQQEDIVLSWPDEEEGMNAKNPSVSMGFVDGEWRPQVVWQELNNPRKTKGLDRANRNEEVHWLPPPTMYTITATSGSDGSINPSGSVEVEEGDNQLFTFNPDPGYHVDYFKVDGFNQGAASSYQFNNVQDNHTIEVYFAINYYFLTVNVLPGSGSGSVTKSPDWPTYPHGTDVTLIAFDNPGWEFKEWTGAASGTSTTTVVAMNGHRTVNANFINEYTQSLSTGWNRVSFPLEQSVTSIETVLDSIDSYWDNARHYNASTGTWKTYQNGVGGTLTDIDHKTGFWLHITSACTLSITGTKPGTTDISLRTGWNMIGYPADSDGTYNIATLKGDVSQVSAVYLESWRLIMTEPADSHVLKRGQLYWVLVTADATWTITW